MTDHTVSNNDERPGPEPGWGQRLFGQLAYVLSIPERLIKTSLAVGGGLVKELTERLLPNVLQETQLFKVFVIRGNRFLLEQIAGVKDLYEDENANPDYASRKVVSNVIEVSSLLTLHLSPVLLLAAASDVMKGAHGILDVLVADLKREGVIDNAAQVENFNDFLNNMHGFTVKLADRADLPPLSLHELQELGSEVKQDVLDLQQRQQLDQKDVESLAHSLHQEAEQGRSIWETASALSLGGAHALVKSAQGIACVSGTTARFIDDQIFTYYGEQMQLVLSEGVSKYFIRVSMPYFNALQSTWDAKHATWTEAFLRNLSQT